jgi:hypothetical protein
MLDPVQLDFSKAVPIQAPCLLDLVPRTRTDPTKLPKPIWKCPHCGNEHSAAQLVRLDGDYLRCTACGKDFKAKAAQKTG